MTRMILPRGPGRRAGASADVRRLWSGAVASAVIVGLLALAGVLVCRWLFHLPVLAPRRNGTFGDVHTAEFAVGAAAAALAAAGLAHLLLLTTPRPLLYFGWIVALLTVLAVVFPFSTTAPLSAKIATAVVDLLIGVMTGALIGGAAARSARGSPPSGGDPRPGPDDGQAGRSF